MPNAEEILQRGLSMLHFEDEQILLSSISSSDEAIIFGSFAFGCETNRSDLDVLVVGEGKRRKSKKLDLIHLPRNRVYSKTWLYSELANHIATYGIWIKGEGSWRWNTKVTSVTINKKKLKILTAFSNLFVKRANLSRLSRLEVLSNIIIDVFRLSYLHKKEAVPPTKIVIENIFSEDMSIIHDTTFELLGDVGSIFLKETLCELEVQDLWFFMMNVSNELCF